MNYILAIILPPVSVFLTGRHVAALLLCLIWVPAVLLSSGLLHPLFVICAWVILYHANEERRAGRPFR